MSEEGPKLLNNKPKKSKLKASTPITMAASSSTGAVAPPPPPPPFPQKEPFVKRYRFLWPLLLVVNFTIGAYVFMRYTMKDNTTSEEAEISKGPTSSSSISATTTAATSTIVEKPISQPIIEPIKRAPIPADHQRELFKWMLEEKRKVKPRDAEEKKRIDEEKAILKQFIRANSIPTI